MTQRSILSGLRPTVIVHAGASVTIRGVEGERVSASATSWGGLGLDSAEGEIKVSIGFNGQVEVPYLSNVKVYAGMNTEVDGVRGDVAVITGLSLTVRSAGQLTAASAGWSINIDCETIAGPEMEIQAGRDLRLTIHSLPSAHVTVTDMSGDWEEIIGDGELRLTLQAGGDVTLVTNQNLEWAPPDS